MSYVVIWTERAVSSGSRYLADESGGLAQVMDATDLLADDPRPVGSFPYGSEDLRRLRVGRYRVLYEVNSVDETVTILHVGRVA